MLFGNASQALLRLARAALAAMLLVVVPLADASSCAGEDLASYDVTAARGGSDANLSSSTDAPDQGGHAPDDAQHCIHGHCHHNTPFRASDTAVKPAIVSAVVLLRPDNQPALQRAAGGLERPPKI